ncbi:MAG: acetyltransferase [Gammaproteobacteria bacterium]|nr:acetyltransferase [Gammaproteobacteria bacterium]
MTIGSHLKAALSLSLITANLLLWSLPLAVALAVRLIIPRTRREVARLNSKIYRYAVVFDDWVLKRIVGARWADPCLELDRDEVIVVIANHRSWTDVFLVQSVIARRGPIVKFLCKKELAYIPLFGLICLAFDFPILQRRARGHQSESERRTSDRQRVRDACKTVYRSPAAMLSFAEGTRYSDEKQRSLKSQYRHLLPPRSGGFSAMLAALEPLDPRVVDVTIVYPHQSNFWRFLAGNSGEIQIVASVYSTKTVVERGVESWLEDRWAAKDLVLDRQRVGR